MGFIIDIDTENVEGFHTVSAGEYQLRILRCESKNSQKGDPMLTVQMDIADDPQSKDIYHNIMLPISSDSEKRSIQKLVNLKELKAAFGLPVSGPIDTEDMEGALGWGILTEDESPEYGKQNRVRRFVVGK